MNGRHNRPAGFLGDLEKFNAAASLDWLVLKFTPQISIKSKKPIFFPKSEYNVII